MAFTGYHTDMGFYPTKGSLYDSTGGVGIPTETPVQMLSITARDRFDNPGPNGVALPMPGTPAVQVNSFFDIFVDFATPTELDRVAGPGRMKFSVTGDSSSATGGEWSLELLEMSFDAFAAGGNPPLSYSLRESPTLQSLGSHTITELPGGITQIDSFFDVFFELSIDGGPFVPADGPVHLELTAIVPEPASFLLACIAGLIGLVRWRRRCG